MTESDGYWHQLRDAAFDYAEHGWPVAPGVRPVPHRRDGWPVPASVALPYHGPMNSTAVAMHWQRHPYSVLVGAGFQCLDVFRLRPPAAAGALQEIADTRQHGPVAVLPDEQWLFLVEAGDPPPNDVLGRQVRYHGPGHWVPLPPTRLGRRHVTWHIEPASTGWRLFPRARFFEALRTIRRTRQ